MALYVYGDDKYYTLNDNLNEYNYSMAAPVVVTGKDAVLRVANVDYIAPVVEYKLKPFKINNCYVTSDNKFAYLR